MANLKFYQQPVALSRSEHKDEKISSLNRTFQFFAGTNSVILAGIEFSEAAEEYPIVFAQGAGILFRLPCSGFVIQKTCR